MAQPEGYQHDRIPKIEWRLEQLEKEHREVVSGLQGVQRTLTQIKYLVMGALGAFVIQQLGISEFIKRVFS